MDLGSRGFCTIRVAKTKVLISFAVTAKLICVFVFVYAKFWFSHDAAHLIILTSAVHEYFLSFIFKHYIEFNTGITESDKVPKFSDARKLCCNLPKIQNKGAKP